MKAKPVIGRREYVAFPDWGIRGVEAKIDTGARTSAIHVDNIKRLRGERVRFDVVLSRLKPDKRVRVEADVVRFTRIRSSTGHQQERFVVAARIRIGEISRKIELSLVSRKQMLCRMLLGRLALSDFLIDVDVKHLHGIPKRRRPKGGTS